LYSQKISMIRHSSNKLVHWLILLLLAFIWGSSFIMMKRGLIAFSHTQVASLRIFIAFLFLIPFAVPHLKTMFREKGRYILLVGIIGNGIPAFLFTKAQTGLSSSLAGMLNSLTPLFTLILSVFIFKDKIRWFNSAGILIGLIGAMGLIAANEGMSFSGSFHYAIYIIIATILYAISVNVIKKFLGDVSSVGIASIAFMFIGPFAGIYLFSTNFTEVLTNNPNALNSIVYIAVLAIIGSALSVMVFNDLIKMTNAIFASSVTYVIPVFALMWGIWDHEQIGIIHVFWIGVILFGVYMVNKRSFAIEAINLNRL
jgi:drug/metabolite transporter (DMT)-like permease